jgi:hypothetical protein
MRAAALGNAVDALAGLFRIGAVHHFRSDHRLARQQIAGTRRSRSQGHGLYIAASRGRGVSVGWFSRKETSFKPRSVVFLLVCLSRSSFVRSLRLARLGGKSGWQPVCTTTLARTSRQLARSRLFSPAPTRQSCGSARTPVISAGPASTLSTQSLDTEIESASSISRISARPSAHGAPPAVGDMERSYVQVFGPSQDWETSNSRKSSRSSRSTTAG